MHILPTMKGFVKRGQTILVAHPVAASMLYFWLIMAVVMGVVYNHQQALKHRYILSPKAQAIVAEPTRQYGYMLRLNAKTQKYEYNAGYTASKDGLAGQTGGPKFTANFSADPMKGVEVTDPQSKLTIGFKPKFDLAAAKQIDNRLVYPLKNSNAVKVDTMYGSGFKEDVVLNKFQGDTFNLDYQLELPSDVEARLQPDGSLGIFGADQTLLGDVTTGSDADAQLLQKARQKSTKSTLIFTFPAPFVKDGSGINKAVKSSYKLEGKHLTIQTKGLSKASYPLTIDPSVYVTSASQFMRGNNETNVDFDTTNNIIQKGTLTGARINYWTKNSISQDLPTALWNHATVVAGGYIYAIGGSTGTSNVATVYWAKLDTTTYTITSPTPGTGAACTQWCTATSYNLPGARAGLAAVAYNGYLYAIGGFDGTPARSTTVYYAKVGANGEPISWSTTTALGTERSYASATAYGNKLYVFGGQSNAATGGITGAGSIQYATINPDGTVGTWTNTTTNMPSARWGMTVMQYNGYMYVVGGASGTTTQSSVEYTLISSTGDLASSWVTSNAFNTARATLGGSFASIWGGYLYVSGGCTTVTATDCTSFASGTMSQSGTTITGTGFSSNMVGMVVTFANGITATITSYTNATTLVAANDSQTVASQSATIDLNDLSPQVASINSDGSISAWRTINLDAGQYYMTGSASIAVGGTNGILTGTGSPVWTVDNIGQNLTFANATTTSITGWVSATSLQTLSNSVVTSQGYTLTSPNVYDTGGTASQSTTTITGVNTNWTTDMAGMTITFANGVTEIIQSVNSATSITVAAGFSQTVASQVFVIRETHSRQFSTGFVAWRNTLYQVGGCKLMNGSGGCTTPSTVNYYGHMNNDGDVSQKRAEATLPTAGTGSGTTTVGRYSQGVVVNNGFIYNVGGCGASPCTTNGDTNANTAYAAIGSDGTITTNGIASCNGGAAATWCIAATQVMAGTIGGAAFGITVYNNTIYIAGGVQITVGLKNAIWYLPLNADGSPNGTFTSATGTFTTAVEYPFIFSRASQTAGQGNLYIIGGCTGTTNLGCSGYQASVYKCTITNSTRLVSACATTNQLQLAQGLAITANAVYGNYIYQCGGANAGGAAQTDTCFYAKLNSTNDIVRSDNGLATGGWQTATAHLPEIRRRTSGFAANGYMYVFGGHDGAPNTPTGTSLHDVSFAKIDTTTGDLTGRAVAAKFDASTTTISARWNLGVAAANGYVYAVGGCTSGGPPTSCAAVGSNGINGVVESVQVYNNYSGSPLAYTTGTNNIGIDNIGSRAVVNNGYIYVAGGCTALACTTGTDLQSVYYASISANGDVGTWATTSAMGTKRAYFGLTAYNGYMYAVGGSNFATVALATTEHAFICDGTATGGCTAGGGNIGKLGTWTADTSMGAGNERADFGFSMFNGYIYVVGGSNNSSVLQTTVFHALLGSGSIGTWTTNDTAFTTARSGMALVAYGQTLFLMGGYDGSNYLFDTQYVNITGTGTIGTWAFGSSLPQAVRQGQGFAANGYLYVVGGRSAASTCTTNTYVAPINGYAPGSTSRFGIGGWSQTIVAFTAARYGQAVAYGAGKAYVMGGGCAAFVGGSDRVYYSTLQAQPQVTNYSIAIDTDTDVFPSKWLLNGVDNGTGAQWILNYKSSTSSAAVWGQNTNAGTVTLGTPGTYTPLDAGGSNTNLTTGARYYFLNTTVDASQAFGFPEDVTRGPTIADLTLQFTSDPSKRLHHGKTFTGGELQPLDAPF
jgi:hypothetical protein